VKSLGLAGELWVKALGIWIAVHLLFGVVSGFIAVAVTRRIRHEIE